MLFNSFAFLLVFLPASLVMHWLVERFRPQWRLPLLLILSFVFYGYWDWRFAPLLAASILVNWFVAQTFLKARQGILITLALIANLLVLGIFKYFNFFADLTSLLSAVVIPKWDIALPLGISFFTFHHVMYLVDLKAGRAPRFGLVRYALYIAFFPQVLAGPLVRWSEIMHQFDERPYKRSDAAERFGRGFMLLILGLAKKVFVSDPLAENVNPIFAQAAAGATIPTLDAWQATLGFTFQIYFDFSGYTDMALGMALTLGIVLPQNFDKPYISTSLQDFWRRWHMTLSRFLRDYLYIPLGGSRNGLGVQIGALFATMALGGLWHGAGLTFIAWGVAHGLGLGAGVLWRRAGLRMPGILGWALTMLFVMFTWVLFRAPSFDAALRIYEGMLGFTTIGETFKWRAIALAAAVACFGPTTWTAVQLVPPRRWIAVGFAVVLMAVLLQIGDSANYEFIYFQF
ncbi:MBOAT family O-acyltransferase [Microvirga lotononidis]|uniref:Probable alginate O-acetylase AlgI n=1 Tax=Microvirga lotononidis TaxID=864069 RepID=I4YV80_9HYPH|nr:MBOAT family O-acyltransferase [Microvirga lotononidis]EIM27872.1 putative membrane protein involved in D-alanine export [Microvirga lotononidis]WQO27999.1 MBOAT family O-acyltransferase [Microvirga lotononidis]